MAARVGFIGLGAMGGDMARRLAGLGFTVAGYEPSATNAKRSGDGGVKLVDSPAAAADGADFVLSSVSDPAAIRRAYLGPNGVLTRVRADARSGRGEAGLRSGARRRPRR